MVWPKWCNRRRRRWVFWAAGLVLFYTVFGFLILPPIVRSVAVKQLSQLLGRSVTIEKVLINPYVLSGTIRGLAIKDPDGELFVGLKEGYVNFQLISFFQRAWTFESIRLAQPYVRVQVNRDSTLNFSDLIRKFSEGSPTPPAPSKPAIVHIEQFQITGAELSYADLTTSTPFRRRIGPLQLTMTGMHTDPDNRNPYSFAGTTDSGERFSWGGYFSLEPLRSHGEFALESVRIPQYTQAFQDLVRFDVRDGTVDLRAAYDFAWTTNLAAASITNALLRLQSVAVAPKGSEEPFIRLGRLEVGGVSADAVRREARVESVVVDGARLEVRRDTNRTVNVVEMSKPADARMSASILMMLQAATNIFAQLITTTNAATGLVREIAVTNCAVAFEDLANPRPVNLRLSDISLAATNLSNLPGEPMGAVASLRWSTNGSLAAQAAAALTPLRAELGFKLDQLDLRPLGPYLDPFVSLRIVESRFSMDGRICLSATNSAGPNATYAGNIRLDDFAGNDADVGGDLLDWGTFAFSGVEASLNPPEVRVAELALKDVSARVILETNNTLNLVRVARLNRGTNTPAPIEAAAEPRPGKAAAEGHQRFGLLARAFSSTNLAFLQTPIKVAVSSVVLSNANIQWEDRSISPAARLALRSVGGTATGVSSALDQPIQIHLLASVDGTGPVEMTGVLPPRAPGATNRIAVKVEHVNLVPTSPYSGKYLGYGLRKGALSLDIDYRVADRKLSAKNVLKLDQLTLGEKVASPDATKLPVKLAVAILKDRNGLIELEVPIDGDLDDPRFHVGKAILHVLGTIVTKMVTSPFTALGSLFGGKGEEVSYQPFAPGSAELDPARRGDLDTLLKGLQQRPGLQLEIEGSFDEVPDTEALRRLKLEKQFKAEKWADLGKSARDRVSPDQVPFTEDEFKASLRRAYQKLMEEKAASNAVAAAATALGSTAPVRSSAGPSGGSAGVKGAALLEGELPKIKPSTPADDIAQAVLQTVSVSQEDLKQLAQQRAERVQQAVLATGLIEAERVSLAAPETLGSSNRACRVFFHLK